MYTYVYFIAIRFHKQTDTWTMTWRWPDVFTIILNVFYLLNKYKLSIRWQNACSGLCATGSSSKVLSFRGLRNLCIKLWYRRFFSFKDNVTITWFWFMCRTLNYHVDVGVVGPSLAVKLRRWGTLSSGDSPVINPLLPGGTGSPGTSSALAPIGPFPGLKLPCVLSYTPCKWKEYGLNARFLKTTLWEKKCKKLACAMIKVWSHSYIQQRLYTKRLTIEQHKQFITGPIILVVCNAKFIRMFN